MVNHAAFPTLIQGFVSQTYGIHAKPVSNIPSSARPQLNGHEPHDAAELASQNAPAEVDATLTQSATTEPGTNRPICLLK